MYIFEAMKNGKNTVIIKSSVLETIKSEKDLTMFTRKMINAMGFVKKNVKQLTEQVKIAMNDQEITPTNVIQDLLKRATNLEKLNQQSVQQNMSVSKDLKLEKQNMQESSVSIKWSTLSLGCETICAQLPLLI
jgi:hypothetical protein